MIKPTLFNTEMVRAIQDGTKTATRRVVKQLADVGFPPDTQFWVSPHSGLIYWGGIDKKLLISGEPVIEPYHSGDILYVRETWCDIWNENGTWLDYGYAVDGEPNTDYWGVFRNGVPIKSFKWRPSIHMPREAARIFLRVTGVRVERLWEITEEQARAEGLYRGWKATETSTMATTAKQAFMWVWDSTIKPADRTLYGWMFNPWVWVIEFERCEEVSI